MRNLFTFLLLFLSFLLVTNSAFAQACTSGCTFTAPSGGTNFDMNGNQLLCITGNLPNGISGNFNGSNNQICQATGTTWTQTNALNLGNVSAINIYGTANLTGISFGAATINVYGTLNLNGVNFNGVATLNVYGSLIVSGTANFNSATTINVTAGSSFQTSSTNFSNNAIVNNASTVTFTSTSAVTFQGASTFNNLAGATVVATAPSLFKFGTGVTVTNAGTMNFANLENEEAIKFDNTSSGVVTVNRSFYNHGAIKNDGLIRTLCASGSGVCEFKVGNKGAGKAYINNACMIVAGDVTFEGPGTLNGTLEIRPGYNITINNIVTGSNGILLVDGGTSTIGAAGQYTGSTNAATSMKFYSASTTNHDFNVKGNQNNASTYTVLTAAPATSCSATAAACAVNVAVTSTTCQTATNQYVLTGTVSFSNTGGSALTIQDGTASTTVSTTGTSPQAFTLTGTSLVSNASSHTITAASSTSTCSTTATAIYTSPASCLTISVTSATVCAGQTATLTATGCIGSVSWNNGLMGSPVSITTSAAITTQTVLSYTATCTSGVSTATAVATVTVRPNPIKPTLTVTQPTCATATGSLTAVSVGATSFTLTGPVTVTNTTGIFVSLNPGSYTVTAGNGTACTSAASTTTITSSVGTPPAPILVVVQPSCVLATGTLTATSVGATSFTLTGPLSATNGTGIFTVLTPGSYTVTAGNGVCSSVGSTTAIVANPGTPLAPALVVVQPDCNLPTGSLTATSVGATSFTLTGGASPVVNSTGVFAGLTPGSYTVTAGNGVCSSVGSTTAIVANPGTPLAPTLVVLQPTCITSTGSLTATSVGATSYTLTNGNTLVVNTTGVFTDLVPDSYTLIAGNGSCSSGGTPTTIIANPGTPETPTLTVVQPTCIIPTSTLTAVAVGANSFTLTNGTTSIVNSTGIFTGLTPGSYTVTAGNGICTSSASTTAVIANPGTPAAPTLVVTQPTATTPTGSLIATSTGATSYTLSGPIAGTNTTGIFTGLSQGSYTVTAGNGICNSPGSTTVINLSSPDVIVIQPTCTTPTGSLTATSAGATSFTLSGPVTGINSTGIFTGLTPGSYTVAAGNGISTSLEVPVVINNNPGTPAAPVLTVVQPNCDIPTGTIAATSTGAISFTLIDGSTATVNATGVFTNLPPHSYTVLAGNSSCTSVGSTTLLIANPGTPAAPVVTVVQPDCITPTGSLTATSAGAMSFTLTNGSTVVVNISGLFTGLAPDSYTVIAGNGTCTSPAATLTVVENPGTPSAPVLTVGQPNCATPTGSLTAVSAGATSYTLTNGTTPIVDATGIFSGLAPDSYTVVASNSSCKSVAAITIVVANPGTPAAPTLTVVQPDCTIPTGSLTATSVGATSYTLTGPVVATNSTGIFTGLTPGPYTVTAGNGVCSSGGTTTVIIANPGTPVTPTLVVVQPDCTIPTGSLTAVSAGATSFTLTSTTTSVVNNTGIFTSLVPGSYTLIAGNAGCSAVGATVVIIANPGTPLAPALVVVQPDCNLPTGSLTATSVGATSFTLTGGASPVVNTTGVFTDLTPGSYTVTAGNGVCSSVGSTTVIVVAPIPPAVPIAVATCSSATVATGSITISSPAAGIGITYSINGTTYQAGNVFTDLAAGVYTVTVQQNGCTSLPASVTISVCSTPLPVKLAGFSGKWVEGVGNQLNWSTVWERNNDYFEIQRSAIAKSFESIGRVTGQGTTSTIQTYEYVDVQPVSDISYYRLKQVDTDGTISYSSIIAIERGVSVGVNLELYPNPTSTELNLRLRVGQAVEEVSIYNAMGHRVVYQGDSRTAVAVKDLDGGVYTIEVKTTSGQVWRQRFIKQ